MTMESPIFDFGMHDRSIRTPGHENFASAERLFRKFDQLGNALDDDIGSYRVVTPGLVLLWLPCSHFAANHRGPYCKFFLNRQWT